MRSQTACSVSLFSNVHILTVVLSKVDCSMDMDPKCGLMLH